MYRLEKLVIYSGLIDDPIMKEYQSLLRAVKKKKMDQHYYELVRMLLGTGKTLEEYIYMKLMASDNSLLENLTHSSYEMSEIDYSCLKNDLTILNHFIHNDLSETLTSVDNPHNLMDQLLKSSELSDCLQAYKEFFESIDDRPIFHEQCQRYVDILRNYGIGEYASNFAFYLNHEEELVPIENYSVLGWDQIYDYEVQKDKLLQNTKALIEGRPFHHGLLVGASGTGKSSSVKAVVELFKDDKLRLIQLYKGQLRHLPKMLESLTNSIFKFVIFIDDLSFEVNEDEYKFLKSFIEGGISNDATNVAFYVTSNRRHLIKEIRSEREGDIHLADFIQEMTSLSGRFGLTLTYDGLAQGAYLSMIHKMLDEQGITYERDEIDLQARRWSMRHGGMSGRVANQFIMDVQMMQNCD